MGLLLWFSSQGDWDTHFTVSPFLAIGTLIMAEGNYPFQIWAPCFTRGAGFERAAAKSVAFCSSSFPLLGMLFDLD